MTLLDGSQIDAQAPQTACVDNDSVHRKPTFSPVAILGELGTLRTEVQVSRTDSFVPEVIVPRHGSAGWATEGSPTKLLAKPPSWVPESTPCTVPPEEKWNRDMREGHWDVGPGDKPGTDEQAAAMCAGCPVREACLQDALEDEVDWTGRPLSYHARFLVRGGMTPKGRWQLAAVENAVGIARSD